MASLADGESQLAFRGHTTACAALAETEWLPLPETKQEVESVRALLGPSEDVLTLTGAAASEESFKRDAHGKRTLHLATHGFFLEGTCAIGASQESPLLLSGLVLAGANARSTVSEASTLDDSGAGTDDGILTAEELAALDLRGVDLAVLSACDTGRGTVAVGEGVFGLRRAFGIAGARTVVMSLWPVPDAQARQWMTRFYSATGDGTSVSRAVRDASLRTLEELRESERPAHPYYWAGFVAAGDWK